MLTIYPDRKRGHRWRLRAPRGGLIIADSGGSYRTRRGAAKGARSALAALQAGRGHVYRDAHGTWRWRAIGRRSRLIVADGGEGYASKRNAERALANVTDRLAKALEGM